MDHKRVKEFDAIAILVNSANEQLRASATTRMSTLREEKQVAISAADDIYREKEAEYLMAVMAWKRADSVQQRTEAAQHVGELHHGLVKADEQRQQSRYPHRYVQNKELFRNVINPDTRDTRKIPFPVYLGRSVATIPTERSIQITGEDRV